MGIFTKKLKLTGYVYDMDKHSGWGNAINWSNYEERRISGHLQRKPVIGDEIIAKMESGKIVRYGVTKVEYMHDPRDMFFADVMDIGYQDEKPINKVKEADKREIEPREGSGLRLLI